MQSRLQTARRWSCLRRFFEERSGEKLAEEDRTLVEQMMRELLEGGES